jgi:hypothetical protein
MLALLALPFVCGASLYGLSNESALVRIDPSTGSMQPIGPPTHLVGRMGLNTCPDTERKLFYFVAVINDGNSSELVGLSLETGQVVVRVLLPFQTSLYFGGATAVDVDPTSGDVFVVGVDATNETLHQVLRVDYEGNNLTQVATLLKGSDALTGGSAFDYKHRVEYIELTVNASSTMIYAIHVDSGKITPIAQSIERGENLQTMAYHPESDAIVGHGLTPVKHPSGEQVYARTLVSLDTATHKFRTISTVNGFLEEAGTVTAIDYGGDSGKGGNAVHYSVLQKLSQPRTKEFYLVGLDIGTGKVVHAAPICDLFDDRDCPRAMGFANAATRHSDSIGDRQQY